MKGTLYIVATPIGNLLDLSERTKEALKQSEIILCEDTRRTRTLLSYLQLKKPLESFHQHNQFSKIPRIMEWLEKGKNLALITDAGTPAVSDPGAHLVQTALEKGIKVVPIPGPSAITTALSVSGLPSDRFLFLGFLPAKATERKKLLEKYQNFPETILLFEAPHRIQKSLKDLLEILGERKVCFCRELTKVFEEIKLIRLSQLVQELEKEEIRGEITLVIAGAKAGFEKKPEEGQVELEGLISEMMAQGKSVKEIVRELCASTNLPKNLLYKKALEIKKRLKS